VSIVLERGPRDEEELWYLTQALWGHKIPRTKVCDDHDAPFDAFVTAYFSREPQILIHGSRGLAGKSRLLSILGLTKAAFAEVYRRHQAEDLPIYTWCYRETSNPIDGWLDPEFIEEKKRQIPAEMWRVEYELGEPSIGNRAFDSEAVERTFSLDPEVLVSKKISKDYEEYCFEKHRQDREYVIAADWAKAQDFTVISVMDVTQFPIRPVYWIRMRRRPYPVMIGEYNRLMKEYHAEGIHDATGLGGVVADYIDSRAYGFMMVGMQRDNMLSDYISAVENDRVRAPRINSFYKTHLYTSVEDVYSRGKEFHLPDEVCSMALAWNLVSRRALPVEPTVLRHLGDNNYMASEIEHNKADKAPGSWVIGNVRNKTDEEQSEISLMV
jgi:hypothetical protein